VNNFTDGILKSFTYQRPVKKSASGMSTKANDRSGLAAAMRAVTARDVYLSIGLAVLVMTLTSVMGSI
jgi:hypothetical protein